MEEAEVGLLATGLYIGNVAGSLICPILFSKFKAKHVIVTAAILNAVAVSIFAIVENYWVIFASRMLTGLF